MVRIHPSPPPLESQPTKCYPLCMSLVIGHLPNNDYPGILNVMADHFRGGTKDLAWQVAQFMTIEALENLVGEANDRWTWENDDPVYREILEILEFCLKKKREVGETPEDVLNGGS